MSDIIRVLQKSLADTYALYLKTQNYHWHVSGPHFQSLHILFEGQYIELAAFVDEIAERILTLGAKAPATFADFNKLKTIEDGNSSLKAHEMVAELAQDRLLLIKDLRKIIALAQTTQDEGTIALISTQLAAHEKAHWMLYASKG